jgi:hypothetical protein
MIASHASSSSYLFVTHLMAMESVYDNFKTQAINNYSTD